MPFTYELPDGRRGIDSKLTFVEAMNGFQVLTLPSFEDVFTRAAELIRQEHADVASSALSNVRGAWYEWLLAIGAAEFCAAYPEASLFLPLPNVTSYDCSKMYTNEIYNFIVDLREKVATAADVSLVTSNPDFAIVKRNREVRTPDLTLGINTMAIDVVGTAYLDLEHTCGLDDVLGYASSKVSLRPDRRLQIAHEGSLMKAIYKHIQTRKWIIDAPGVKYYAITSTANEADRNALKTVATHSITDVGSQPQAAVDELYCVSSGPELERVLSAILL